MTIEGDLRRKNDKRARDRAYYARNRESIRTRRNQEYADDPARQIRMAAKNASYRTANLERIRVQQRSYYRAHRLEKKAKNAQQYKQNAEVRRAYANAYRAEHPEKTQAASRQWLEQNWDRVLENARNWRINHPERVAAYHLRRRALKAGAPGSHSDIEWREKLDLFANCCAYCGRDDVRLTRDHRIPLTRGGSDAIANIVPACHSCNSRKGKKTDHEFIQWRAAA